MSCPAHLINPVQLILRRAEADANLNHISPLYEELVFEAPAYVINITQKSPTKYGEKKIKRDTQGKSFSDIQTHGQSSWYKCTGGHDSMKTAHPIGESDSLSITFTTSFLNFVHFDSFAFDTAGGSYKLDMPYDRYFEGMLEPSSRVCMFSALCSDEDAQLV